MIEPYTKDIEAQMQELYGRLPEKNRRLYAGVEALKFLYGGISYIAGLFGCSPLCQYDLRHLPLGN